MSTTVTATRSKALLFFASWAMPKVDMEALNAVLRRHGLCPKGLGQPSLEFIAAEGLPEAAAQRLAADLRAIGLSTSVHLGGAMDKSPLMRRARLSNAAAMAMSGGMVMPLGMLIGMPDGVLAVLVPAAITIANVIPMLIHGEKLHRVSAPVQAGSLTARLLELRDAMPDAVLADLLSEARDLDRHAALHPQGKVAQALQGVKAQLNTQRDQTQRAQVQALREELERIQQAASEARTPRKQ